MNLVTARCPVCSKECKLVGGKLARHGYTRTRGRATIAGIAVNVCWGTLAVPSEAKAQAIEVARYHRDAYAEQNLTETVVGLDAFIARLSN